MAISTLNATTEGDDPGQYPSGAKATLQNAVNLAQTLFNDSTGNQIQVTQAIVDLQQALNVFVGSVIVEELDKALLTELIGGVQEKHNSSEEGTKLTQYVVGSKAALQAAINQAITVLGTAATQQVLDDAVNTLSAASQTFNNQIVTLIPGATQITIKDLSLIAKYYGKTRVEANWDLYDTADIYGDGISIQVLAKIARMIVEDWISQQ